MAIDELLNSSVTVTEVEEFLRKPPAGFSVEVVGSGFRVHSDPEESLVLIDDFNSCRGRVVYQSSLGRKIKMQNLWEYTSMRKSLLSKRIYLLMCACEPASKDRVLQQYVVSIHCNNPYFKWQMERGLDRAISSVSGESYRVEIDLSEILESWAAKNIHLMTDGLNKVQPVWKDASFTLKYYSDALFDFPHWFGFSKRTFRLRLTRASSS